MGSSIPDPYVPGPGEVFYPLFSADSPRNVGKTRRAGISNLGKHNAQPGFLYSDVKNHTLHPSVTSDTVRGEIHIK